MSIKRLQAQYRRSQALIREHGLRQFAALFASWFRARLGHVSRGRKEYLAHKSGIDAAFDAEHGVRTGGVEYLYDLTIVGENARFGIHHIASDPSEFHLAMERLDIDLTSATFVDFGSGRGRALIMAAALPFQKIIGIEFAKELHEESLLNLAHALGEGVERVASILGDATTFILPTSPLVLYLYNPFDAPIVGAVARQAMASWKADPRPIRVVYLNPVFGAEWQNAGWHLLETGEGRAIFGPPLE